MKGEQVATKWQDYLFLTREMKQFLIACDLKFFYSLLEQRQQLQDQIQSFHDTEYHSSVEGKKLLLSIQQLNQEMVQQFQLVMNTVKRGQAVTQAYEGTAIFSNTSFNRQT